MRAGGGGVSDLRDVERDRLIDRAQAARNEALEQLHCLDAKAIGWTSSDWRLRDELVRRFRVAADEEWWLLEGGDPGAPLRVVLRDE